MKKESERVKTPISSVFFHYNKKEDGFSRVQEVYEAYSLLKSKLQFDKEAQAKMHDNTMFFYYDTKGGKFLRAREVYEAYSLLKSKLQFNKEAKECFHHIRQEDKINQKANLGG